MWDAYDQWQQVNNFDSKREDAKNLYMLYEEDSFDDEDSKEAVITCLEGIITSIKLEMDQLSEEDEESENEADLDETIEEEASDAVSETDRLESETDHSDSDNEEEKVESLAEHAKSLDDDGDDSTDEDTVNRAIAAYDIEEKFSLFKKSCGEAFIAEDQFSFVAHAFGIEMLYSESVNDVYYSENKPTISTNFSQQLQVFFTKSIFSVLDIMVGHCMELFFPTKQTGALPDLSSLQSIIDEIAHELTLAVGQYIRHHRGGSQTRLLNEALKQINFSQAQLKSLVKGLVNGLQKYSYRQPQVLSSENFSVQPHFTSQLFIFVTNKCEEIFAPLKINLSRTRGTVAEIFRREKEKIIKPGPYQDFCQYLYDEITKDKEPNKKLSTLMGCIRTELSFYYLQGLIAEQNNAASVAYWQMTHQAPWLKLFFQADACCLQVEIEHQLPLLLHKQLKNGASLYRAHLQKDHIYRNNNPYGLFANIRLNHRSQTHRMRNYEDSEMGNLGRKIVAKWQMTSLPITQVDEEQTLTYSAERAKKSDKTAYGRNELVVQLDTYKVILQNEEKLKKLLVKYAIAATAEDADKKIALYLREIFHGKVPEWYYQDDLNPTDKQEAIEFLAALTYLLLGCECRRNPALIIVNQMMLDLIIQGNLSWQDALQSGRGAEKGIMPMAPSGATSVARYLNDKLNAYMPWRYQYLGDEVQQKVVKDKKGNVTELFNTELLKEYETAIIVRWLKMTTSYPGTFAQAKDYFAQQPLSEMVNLIKSAYEGWFECATEQSTIPNILCDESAVESCYNINVN